MNFPSNKNFKMQSSADEVMCTGCTGKGVILLDFLEHGKNINSDSYIVMLSRRPKLPDHISKKAIFLLKYVRPEIIPT